jgi:membrane protease YdiL (CAAX protease family)
MASVLLVRVFGSSKEDIGPRVLSWQTRAHLLWSFRILILCLHFYLSAIRMSALNPSSSAILWCVLICLSVVLAEELRFRGALHAFIEKRFSAETALIVSSVVLGSVSC